MISAKQLQQVLNNSFNGTAFSNPTASFIATPSYYTINNIPGAISLSGDIIINDATGISWTITEGVNILASGLGTTVLHNLALIPTLVSTTIYNLNITYTGSSSSETLTIDTSVEVTSSALIGQLNGPATDIIIPTDLTPLIEATLINKSKVEIINFFTITATYFSGRIIIVIPNDFGTITWLEDGAGLNVLSQFNTILDPINNRIIYTSNSPVVPGNYSYKTSF